MNLTASVFAGTVTLVWKDQPACDFHVWSGTRLLKTIKGNEVTLTLPDSGISAVQITAFKPGGFGESTPAEIKLVPVPIWRTNDLGTWTLWRILYDELAPAAFYRTYNVKPPAITP